MKKRAQIYLLALILLLFLIPTVYAGFWSNIIEKIRPTGKATYQTGNECTDTDRIDYPDELQENVMGRTYGTEWGNAFDKTDECVTSNILREYYCASTGEVGASQYTCAYGCREGKCLVGECTDTDQSRYNYNITGRVYGTAYGAAFDHTDECVSSNILREYYCASNGDSSADAYTCQYGCNNGKCQNDCDPDITTCGSCGHSWVSSGETAAFGEYSGIDELECCGDDYGEYYIDVDKNCPGATGKTACCNSADDKIDVNGRCVSECPTTTLPPTGNVCTDTDQSRYNYDVSGRIYGIENGNLINYTDLCLTDNILREYYCASTGEGGADQYNCPYLCRNGRCVVAECTDTDQSRYDYNSAGRVQGTAYGAAFDHTDECVTSNILREYYCASNGDSSADAYTCPYGCRNGVCLSANECTDTDRSRYNYSVMGRVYGIEFGNEFDYTDTCVGENLLREYYCSSTGEAGADQYTCPFTCNNGACNKCTDTDQSRNNYNITGRVYGTEWGNDFDHTDECVTSNILREYYCASNGDVSADAYTCPYGCRNGKCIGLVYTGTNACIDTDQGKDYESTGRSYGFENENLFDHTDECVTSNILREYYCASTGEASADAYTCPYGCRSGKCVVGECTDTDQSRYDYNSAGRVQGTSYGAAFDYTDECVVGTNDTLREYYCASNGDVSADAYTCPYGCSGGACLAASPGSSNQCTDTDGRYDYNTAGRTYGIEWGNEFDYTDTCVGENLLREYYCASTGEAGADQSTCTYGCREGKCLVGECTDTDQGRYTYNITGRVYGTAYGVAFNYTDNCVDDNTLREYYCASNGDSSADAYTCQYGCRNGFCAPLPYCPPTSTPLGYQETLYMESSTTDKNGLFCTLFSYGDNGHMKIIHVTEEGRGLYFDVEGAARQTNFNNYAGVRELCRALAPLDTNDGSGRIEWNAGGITGIIELGSGDGEAYDCKRLIEYPVVYCDNNSIVGDANDDENITYIDADVINDLASGIETNYLFIPENKCCIDVNNDGELNETDSQLVSNYNAQSGETGNVGEICSDVVVVSCSSSSIIGDANGDGIITPGDALIITNIAQGIEEVPTNKCCVDVDNDGDVDQDDGTKAFNYYLNTGNIANAGLECSELAAAPQEVGGEDSVFQKLVEWFNSLFG